MFLNSEKISFKYVEEKTVLDNISFCLKKTNTLSLVGASGCGKSTLLRIISGILLPSNEHKLSGNISINGQTPDEYRKSGKLSFMFQEPTLMPNLSVKENISFPLKIQGITDNPRVDNLIEIVGLKEFKNYLPKQLSGGMKTRVALARSFVTKPELLLLDEPFSALDIAWKSKLYTELEKLVKEFNTTVILVTHDVQEAILLSNNIIALNNLGKIQESWSINSNKSITERVNNISGFMAEVYSEFMLPIQDAIIKGKNIGNEVALRQAESITQTERRRNEKVDALSIA